jgi:hypothetical protein
MAKKDNVYDVAMQVNLVIHAATEQEASMKAGQQCMGLDGIARVKPVQVTHPASGGRWTPDSNGVMRPA